MTKQTNISVRWIYRTDRTSHGRQSSGQKPALCFRGRVHALCVAAGHPVRILKRPVEEFDKCRLVFQPQDLQGKPATKDTPMAEVYPPQQAVKVLEGLAEKNGITEGARKLLNRIKAETDFIDEDDYTDEEELTMETETTATKAETTAAKAETTLAASTKTPSNRGKQAKTPKNKGSKGMAGQVAAKGVDCKSPGKASPGNKGSQKVTTKEETMKTRKNKAAAKTAKANGNGKRDPLGREGTLARFISDGIMKGGSNADVSAAAKKKFPRKASTEVSHVAWQRFNLKRRGVKVPAVKE